MARPRDLADSGIVINTLDSVTSNIQSQLDGKQEYDLNLTGFVNAFTLPIADGSNGQVLSTDGAGSLSFVDGSDPNALTSSDIGVTVQPYNANILTSSDIGVTVQPYVTGILTESDIGSLVQDYDLNLTDFLTEFTLPIADGTSGQVLQTNGLGTLSFVDVGGGSSYGDSDVATYLTSNGYDTSTNIIASITDSAPATLDTLNELAAALGDDPNFATTVSNSLGLKANTADLATVATSGSYNDLTDTPTGGGGGSGTRGTLTKTFLSGESYNIALNSSELVPVVSVIKQVGLAGSIATNSDWDVNSNTENYTRLNTATFTTLDFTSGGSPFVLGSGSFSIKDVGKTIEANSGKFVLTETDGSFVETVAPTSYDQIAAGSWGMYSVIYNATDDDLEVSGALYNTFDIVYASYTGNSFDASAQDTSIAGLAFNPDGTRMFLTGYTNDRVYQYNLSTGFDLSTASYVQYFNPTAQDTAMTDIAFNTDGTKMFLAGNVNDYIYEYTLSTGFDISTASYSQSVNVTLYNTTTVGVSFSADGTKMLITSSAPTDNIFYYTLSTAFDVSTAVYGTNFSVNGVDSSPYAATFSPDGTRIFFVGSYNDRVYQYDLSTPYAITTATQSATFGLYSQMTSPSSIAFNPSGSKMFIVDNANDRVYEYNIGSFVGPYGYQVVHTTTSTDSSSWLDINTMTADDAARDGNVYYAISTDDRASWTVIDNTLGERDIVRNNTGTWQYNANLTYGSETWTDAATNTELAALEESMVVGGYSLADTSFVNSYNFSIVDSALTGLTFGNNGVYMYVVGFVNDTIYRYTLGTPYDPTTFIQPFNKSQNIGQYDTAPFGLALSEDGSKLFVLGTGSYSIDQFTLSTPFDINTLSFDVTLNLTSYDSVPVAFGLSKDGTKLYVAGQTNDKLYEFTLSTPWDISTSSFVNSISILAQTIQPRGLWVHPRGTRIFIIDSIADLVLEYGLSTPYDISTATFTTSSSIAAQDTSPTGLAFSADGSKMIICGNQNDSVYQFTTQALNPNQMTKTQLNAVTDLNHITLGNDLDLAIMFNRASSSSAVPSSNGISINYDANETFKGAILGTDYDFEVPSNNSVIITALADNNLKVRVL